MIEIKELEMLLNTLNAIEIKGKENLDMLLGSIQLVEKLIKTCRNSSDTELKEVNTNGR